MLAAIDNFPTGRILGEEDELGSEEQSGSQFNDTQIEREVLRPKIATREDFMAMLRACSRPPKPIPSEEVGTAPLFDTFVNLYQPKIHRRRPSLQMLQSIVTNAASNPALSRSTKTVSLLVLSREHRQPHFSHAAIEMYIDALRSARQEICNPDLDRVTLISVGHMLSICELFLGSTLDDSGSRHHTKWVISLVESCCQDPKFPTAHPLRASPLRLFATWEALTVRHLPSGLPLPAEDSRVHASASMATLSDLSITTASLLERSDTSCMQRSLSSASQLLDFLNELVRVESKLHGCMKSYYEVNAGVHYQYSVTRTDKRRGVTPLFHFSYEFTDLESTTMHIGYWMCLLALTDTRLDISKAYRRLLDIESSEPFARLEKLVNEYADHICMSIPFMGRPSCGWSGRVIAIRPLRFLLQHFRKRGDWQKLSWCVQCAADLAV